MLKKLNYVENPKSQKVCYCFLASWKIILIFFKKKSRNHEITLEIKDN